MSDDPVVEECLHEWGYHSEHWCDLELNHEEAHSCPCGAWREDD